MSSNPNIVAWDEQANEEDTSRNVEVNGSVPGGSTAQDYVIDGDGVGRTIWVIGPGDPDPDGAEPEDLIFEEQ